MNIRKDTLINVLYLGLPILIGLLASFLGPKLFGKLGEAKWLTAQNQIPLIELALEKYHEDKGQFPTTDEGLNILVEQMDRKGEPYIISKILTDPWGKPYNYRIPGIYNKTRYDLWSLGADGKEGGGDFDRDINNWEK